MCLIKIKIFAILIISICSQLCESAPVINVESLEETPFKYVYVYSNRSPDQKIFWNSVGDFIMGTGIFPIEVNVPDIVNNIVTGASGAVGGALQRIPIINRFSAVQPRPKQFYVLVPLQQNNFGYYTPLFDSFSNKFPTYP